MELESAHLRSTRAPYMEGNAPVTTNKLDVAIIGGGLAGNSLARQLKRTFPELRVGVFEKNASTTFKVGESTVEVAANYLIRRIGLSGYLYDQHLPKNGLRFFFDRPDKSAPFIDMSEIGGSIRFSEAFLYSASSGSLISPCIIICGCPNICRISILIKTSCASNCLSVRAF